MLQRLYPLSCSLWENGGSRKQDLATTKDWQHGTDGQEERNDVDMQGRSAALNTDKRRGYWWDHCCIISYGAIHLQPTLKDNILLKLPEWLLQLNENFFFITSFTDPCRCNPYGFLSSEQYNSSDFDNPGSVEIRASKYISVAPLLRTLQYVLRQFQSEWR